MASIRDKKTLRDVLRVLFRRWKLFLLAASVFAMGAMLAADHLPVKYTGTTKFERSSDPSTEFGRSAGSESFETLKLKLRHELAGQAAVLQVAEELGLLRELPRDADGSLTRAGRARRQQIVQELMSNINIRWEVRSKSLDLISISVTHSDPRLARDVPNALARNYIDKVYKEILSGLERRHKFFLEQAEQRDRRLLELRDKRIEFEVEHAGMMPESPGALQERIRLARAEIENLHQEQVIAEKTLSALDRLRQSTTAPSTQPVEVVMGPNPERDRLEKQLRAYEDRLSMALNPGGMTEKHPTVIALRGKIEQLKKEIAETPEETVLEKVYPGGGHTSPNAVTLDAATARATARLEATTKHIEQKEALLAKLEENMANFAPIRLKYMDIVEKVREQEKDLSLWQKRATDLKMTLAAEKAKRRTHLEAVERAEEQYQPSSPSLWTVLATAIVGGLAFGGGLVFLSLRLDHTVTSGEEATEHFGVPVHGVISEILSRRRRIARRIRQWGLGPALILVALAGLSLCALNITLRLEAPQAYDQWRSSPVQFLGRSASGLAQRVKDAI
jgi:uncharacterized protein involved in exopolysaccharide biosynthesis